MGRSADLRGGPARVLHAWDEKVPGYGNVLGMLSFGHEECGAYPEAEAAGRQAMELDREDLWALHAVAHVLEMQGRLKEGLAWLDFPANAWDDRNPFRGHLWWHRALFLYEGGDYEAVLALYDRSIASEKSDFYLDIQNAAALLARLEFAGVNVGDRWGHLAEHVEGRLDDHVLAFTDTHAMMALAATGRGDAAMRLLASLEAFSGTTGTSRRPALRPAGGARRRGSSGGPSDRRRRRRATRGRRCRRDDRDFVVHVDGLCVERFDHLDTRSDDRIEGGEIVRLFLEHGEIQPGLRLVRRLRFSDFGCLSLG